MDDITYSDDEIILALHICENYAGCCSEYCPMIKDNDCRQHLMKQVIDLIDRLSCELKVLKMDRDQLKSDIVNLIMNQSYF